MPVDEQLPDAVEAPPFLRTWPRVYGAIVTYLSLLLAVLYMITKVFRY